jgi:non-ribosomal peptide synthase protein (TIGR01720 family)
MEQVAADLHTSLDITHGPIVRAAYFFRGPNTTGRLLLVIHHLVVDISSWQILIDMLRTTYRQLEQGLPVTLPPKTTSLRTWAERLADYAQSPALERERDYWLDPARRNVESLPVDHASGANTVASTCTVTVALSADETQVLLRDVSKAYHTQMSEVLLMSLALGVKTWSGAQQVLIDLEGHGRESLFADVDLSRTVGWFTSVYPVLLDLGRVAEPGAALHAIKEQVRAVPQGGIGYGLLRYLRGEAALTAELRALPQPQILFNYLGRTEAGGPDLLFGPASESSGPSQPPMVPRIHLLEIDGLLTDGRVQLEVTYSEQIHEIAHCQAPNAGSLIASDFPLANLDQEKLSKLANLIDQLDISEVVE